MTVSVRQTGFMDLAKPYKYRAIRLSKKAARKISGKKFCQNGVFLSGLDNYSNR
jgi:hypothetical protein